MEISLDSIRIPITNTALASTFHPHQDLLNQLVTYHHLHPLHLPLLLLPIRFLVTATITAVVGVDVIITINLICHLFSKMMIVCYPQLNLVKLVAIDIQVLHHQVLPRLHTLHCYHHLLLSFVNVASAVTKVLLAFNSYQFASHRHHLLPLLHLLNLHYRRHHHQVIIKINFNYFSHENHLLSVT